MRATSERDLNHYIFHLFVFNKSEDDGKLQKSHRRRYRTRVPLGRSATRCVEGSATIAGGSNTNLGSESECRRARSARHCFSLSPASVHVSS